MSIFGDVTGIGAVADAVKSVVDKFIPDKTEAQKQEFQIALVKLTQEAAQTQSQLEIDKAEASSPDRVNHWRGALGWVCVSAMAWEYVGKPIAAFFCALYHYPIALPTLDTGTLSTLLLSMLGITAAHVYQQVKS